MSFSIQRAVSDGTLALLPISIEYFDREEISVLFDGIVDARQWAWVGVDDATLSFTPPVANLVEVSVLRTTDLSALRHAFSMGAQFTTTSLDESLLQILHIAQEAKEGSGLGEVYQNLNFHGFKAINMGNGSDPGDAVNHAQMQVHDATIVGYMNAADASADAAAASAVAAAASAASLNPGVPMGVATLNGAGKVVQTALQADTATTAGSATTADSATTATTALGLNFTGTSGAIKVAGVDRVVIDSGGIASGIKAGSVTNTELATAVKPLGVGQTWQDLTASRALSTTYTNSTGRPIQIVIGYTGAIATPTLIINGLSIFCNTLPNAGYQGQINIIVPDGNTYRINPGGGESIVKWLELR